MFLTKFSRHYDLPLLSTLLSNMEGRLKSTWGARGLSAAAGTRPRVFGCSLLLCGVLSNLSVVQAGPLGGVGEVFARKNDDSGPAVQVWVRTTKMSTTYC